MNPTPMIFISYRRGQLDEVRPIVAALEAADVGVFLDIEDIDPLADFPARIAQGIARSHALLAWWSEAYGDSDHCLNEFKLAWQHARRQSSDVGRRVWVLNPEADARHIHAGDLNAQNFLKAPTGDAAAEWAQVLLSRLAALLPEGPLADERHTRVVAPPAPAAMFGVPHGNPSFVGRNAELMRIHSLTHPPKIGPAKRDVAVQTHGLGGVGKTELAIQYARQFDGAYPDGIYWLNLAGFDPDRYPKATLVESAQAAWADALTQTFGETPQLLRDAEGKPLPPNELRGRLARHFGDGEYLWVLDNVPHIRDESQRDRIIDFWRASGANGRTLITTRDRAPMDGFVPLPLGVLNAEDGLRLLAKFRRPANPSERGAAEALVTELGGHPQALGLLGRWIETSSSDTPYAKARADVAQGGALRRIEEIAARLKEQLGNKARGIVASFELSINALSPDARELLKLASVCAANLAIPRGLLADAFGDAQSHDRSSLALGQLLSHSLLGMRNESTAVEIHPLLAEAALLLLGTSTDERARLVERLGATLLTRIQTANDPNQRDEHTDDMRQAYALARRLESGLGVRLALHVGNFYRNVRASYGQASEIERYAVDTACHVLGEEHPDTLTAMNNLAGTLHAQGDLAGALELQKSALATRHRVLGEEHPDIRTPSRP